MHAQTLKALFRGILASTVVGTPLMWLACSGSSAGNGSAPTDAAIDAPDSDGYPCEAGLVVVETLRSQCYFEVTLPCGFDGSTLPDGECASLCPDIAPTEACGVQPFDAGLALVNCGVCANGRRPMTFPIPTRPSSQNRGAVAIWFTNVAALEAASVAAFHELRDALRHFGAPRSLLDACNRAALDERRHARSMARLGCVATPPLPRHARKAAAPSLEALAAHNAREGCVRETYGALVTTVQSARAADTRRRRALHSIARDETRHAALAWRVHAWAMRRLSTTERSRVVEAARDAERALLRELATSPAREVRAKLGVPTADHAVAMALALYASMDLRVTTGSDRGVLRPL
jgi:hypothetical protein